MKMPPALLGHLGSGRFSGLGDRPPNCHDEVTDHRKDDKEYDDPEKKAHKKRKRGVL
jgi:hypothetical protein